MKTAVYSLASKYREAFISRRGRYILSGVGWDQGIVYSLGQDRSQGRDSKWELMLLRVHWMCERHVNNTVQSVYTIYRMCDKHKNLSYPSANTYK